MRVLNALLLLLAVIGSVMVIRQQTATAELKTEYNRLAEKVGRLDVSGKQRFHIVRYGEKTNKAFRFRWHAPPDMELVWVRKGISFISRGAAGGTSSGLPATGEGETQQISVLFRFTESKIEAASLQEGSQAIHTIAQGATADYLIKHWDQLEFWANGDPKQAESKTNEVLKVLEIRLPQDLVEQSESEKFGGIGRKLKNKPVFCLEIGRPESFDAAR